MSTGNSTRSTKGEVPEQLKEHQWKPGQSGNPSGRPKDVMKSFQREEFAAMSDDDKRKFLKTVPALDRWKMGEGNPHSTTDITSNDLPIPIFGNVHSDLGNKKDKKAD